jgi:hypothetical protein
MVWRQLTELNEAQETNWIPSHNITYITFLRFVSPCIIVQSYNSNKSPIRWNNFSVYYPDVYLQLNMFRARFPAHHHELSDRLWFYLRIVVIVVLCSWSGRPNTLSIINLITQIIRATLSRDHEDTRWKVTSSPVHCSTLYTQNTHIISLTFHNSPMNTHTQTTRRKDRSSTELSVLVTQPWRLVEHAWDASLPSTTRECHHAQDM